MFGNRMLFWRFLRCNKLEQLEFKLEKILGFRNMQEKLEKAIIGSDQNISLLAKIYFLLFPAYKIFKKHDLNFYLPTYQELIDCK
jgi:hypothetical protein